MSQKQLAFKIVHNFRKHKTRRHRHPKTIPPSSIKTRHMAILEQNKEPQEQMLSMELIQQARSIHPSDQLYDQILREDDNQVLENAMRTSPDNYYQSYFTFTSTKITNPYQMEQQN